MDVPGESIQEARERLETCFTILFSLSTSLFMLTISQACRAYHCRTSTLNRLTMRPYYFFISQMAMSMIMYAIQLSIIAFKPRPSMMSVNIILCYFPGILALLNMNEIMMGWHSVRLVVAYQKKVPLDQQNVFIDDHFKQERRASVLFACHKGLLILLFCASTFWSIRLSMQGI